MHIASKILIILLLSVATCCATGCQILRSNDRASTAYEATRVRIENGDKDAVGVRQASYQADDDAPRSELPPSLREEASSKSLSQQFKKSFTKDANPAAAKKLYNEAEAQFRLASAPKRRSKETSESLFTSAATTYKKAAKAWPNSALEQDALFMMGESYYFADSYEDSNLAFELLLKKYPNSRHLDVAEARRFSIARYWLEMHEVKPVSVFGYNWFDRRRPRRDTFGSAVKIFNKIRQEDPIGRLADDATMASATAYFTKGDYIKADDAFTDLRRTFPSSEHQFRAHLLGVQTKLATYQGPEYDGTALDQAEHLLKQMRKQFPQQAREHDDDIRKAEKDVHLRKAQREWKQASYYDRRGEYGAARMHYEVLLKDYSRTSFADRAQKRIDEVRDRPATPPQRLSWLANAFPEPKANKPLISSDSPTKRR